MTKELFIKSINSIEQQIKYDISVSENLSNAFPNAFKANLIPDNNILQDALFSILEYVMNDTEKWIQYYCWELDFGKENWRLKVNDENGNDIPLSSPEELYSFLTKKY